MSAEQPTVEELQRELAALRARTAELEQRNQVLQALTAASPDFIFVVDAEGRHLDILPTKAPVADRRLIGQRLHDVRPPEEAERFLQLINAALNSGEPQVVTFPAEADGRTFWVEVSVLPLDQARAIWVARDITSSKELEQRERELALFKQVVDQAPDGIMVTDIRGTITYANQAWATMSGYPHGGLGMKLADAIVEEERENLPQSFDTTLPMKNWRGEWTYLRADGSTFPGVVVANLISNEQGAPIAVSGVVRDLSEERRAQEERAGLQEQVIDAQRAALREVSTPLIPLADDVVVMPLVGAIDSARAQQIMEVLLEGIAHYQADTVLLDISGVRVVDTQVADALLRSARAVQLLGAQIILTGISADVAQTIVHLGADMGRIMTRANLQDGLRYVLEERAR